MICDISVVVPAFNEAENLPSLIERVVKTVEPITTEYEIIIVNDGSTDATETVMAAESVKNSRVKSIAFARNFGHQAALNAGIECAGGNAVVTMDADLQHPPELIAQLYQEYKAGYDLVLTERRVNKDKGEVKSSVGTMFYTLLNAMSDFEIRANVADFNLYSRAVVEVLKKLPEKDRFLRGLVQWVGFNKKYISYEAGERLHGTSKYTLGKMMSLAITGITSFSAFPLRLAWWLGLSISVFGFCYGGYIVVDYFISPSHFITGWTSSVIVVLIIGGVQLLILGIMGEYVAKIFYEIKGRPAYIIKSTRGFDTTK